jgi:hypothetical protein
MTVAMQDSMQEWSSVVSMVLKEQPIILITVIDTKKYYAECIGLGFSPFYHLTKYR